MHEHPALTAEELLSDVRWLRRFARRLVRDPEDAEDVTQEVWVSVLEHAPRDIDRAGLRSWLARVARNVAAHRWRDLTLRRHHETARARAAPRTTESSAAGELVELQRQHELVGRLLELEEPYRAALLLRFRRELDYPAMARALGIAEAAVRKRVSRGLALLRERLATELGDDWQESFAILAGTPAAPSPTRIVPWVAGGATVLLVGFALRAMRASEPRAWCAVVLLAPEEVEPGPAERAALEGMRRYVGCAGFAWELEGRILSQRQLFGAGADEGQSDALIGWDPATSRLVLQSFHTPLAEFESSSEGWIELDAESALLSESMVFEPGGARQRYRERLLLAGPNRMEHTTEFLDGDGRWLLPGDVPPELLACGILGARMPEEGFPSELRHTEEDERALRGIEPFLGAWRPPEGEGEDELALAWGIEGRTVHVSESHDRPDGSPWRAHGLIGWHHGERALTLLEFFPGGVNRGLCGLDPDGSLWLEFRAFSASGGESEHRQRFRLEGPDAWRLERESREGGAAWRPLEELRGVRVARAASVAGAEVVTGRR